MSNIPYGGEGVPGGVDTQEFSYVELLAGHAPAIASRAEKANGTVAIPAFTVVGLVGDYIFPATDNFVAGTQATATVTFSGGVPTAEDTVTVEGREYTFVVAPDEEDEVAIGGTAGETAANFAAVINGEITGQSAHEDVRAHITAAGVVTLVARTPGTDGNALTLTESADNVAVSGGGTLSGGNNQVGVQAVGITLAPVLGNAKVQGVGVAFQGNFNINALNFDESFDAEWRKLRAFDGAPSPTSILLQKIG